MRSSIRANAGDAELIRLADTRRLLGELGSGVLEAVGRVLDRGAFVSGVESASLEEEFSRWIGLGGAVAMGSGNAALQSTLHAIGIGPGDVVASAANLDLSAVAPVVQLGAGLSWVDIVEGGTGMDPSHLAEHWDPRTRAVLVVHTHGYTTDVEAVVAVAHNRGALVIEDITHGPGARVDGRRVGTIGDAVVVSCAPTKPFGTIGNLGLLASDDPSLVRRAREYGAYGFDLDSLDALHRGEPGARFAYAAVGVNGLPSELEAAVARLKVSKLDEWAGRRREHESIVRGALREVLADPLGPVESSPGGVAAPRHAVIRVPRRDDVVSALAEAGVATTLNYVPSLHRHRAVPGSAIDLPVTDALDETLVCVPCGPELRPDEVELVATELVAAVVAAR
jgi:dTDP-4-amino-4,6-dideoxygalactose transaminase